ncbi:NEDD8-conjugating enzyme UBC12 [Nosema bombycis CQ1]|uniref:NEDD8-conjugating enzyme UBC12 n=1 Tax=Nosema bombycis (strain CQ1 / CVCC 102059) TaxID=578461 RepID=R0KWL7_NOSB1|nr:NEDD8-conjugating enzyme UBC12 [Nosema bombycis CQ1]|eukprot:EOB15281.1 NEDD8-conjugating enzyme UBC12 [Nosema bombycis CQ1]
MTSFALFRLENELQDIHLLDNTSYKIINTEIGICSILFTISLSEGLYKGRILEFVIDIPKDYPFTGPKIKIKNKIYHPNVDEEGRVCLEILREGWSCGFGLENIFINLFCILMEPSNENALNGEVGEMMEKDYEEFKKRAREVK